MSLLPSTQSIVERLEVLSQRPVHITEDGSITALADIKIARGDQPFHLLRYKPTGSTPPDYRNSPLEVMAYDHEAPARSGILR